MCQALFGNFDGVITMIEKASVLLATHNGAHYFSEQIESIISQKFERFNVYVQDDSSTDSTVQHITQYTSSYKNIIMLKNKKKFGSAARNFFSMIKDCPVGGDEIVFLSDQDDIWHREKMCIAAEKIRGGVDLYSSALAPFDDKTGQRLKILKPRYAPTGFDHFFQGLSAGCTYAMSPRLFAALRAFIYESEINFESLDFSHDWLIYTFARSNGFLIYHDPTPRIDYRQHDANVQGAAYGPRGVLFRLREIKKDWYFQQVEMNIIFTKYGTIERRVIEAVIKRDILFLFRNVRHLRRSIFQSFALILLCALRKA